MTFRSDDPSMYQVAHQGCNCDQCNTVRLNNWYAANDTRIGGGGRYISWDEMYGNIHTGNTGYENWR